ncbi:MAG: GNAT family N-acetyltransferase, partial [Parvibaculaceae bacterium]|nr:GNAT family N-acetyltransferase [Parvibaculaceae bacterium]
EAEGFIMVRAGGGEAEILTICVVPAARGQRLGERLITTALAHLLAFGEPISPDPENATKGVPLFLEVAESNQAARALYVRMGFEIVGKRPNYYRHEDGRQETALMMKLQP